MIRDAAYRCLMMVTVLLGFTFLIHIGAENSYLYSDLNRSIIPFSAVDNAYIEIDGNQFLGSFFNGSLKSGSDWSDAYVISGLIFGPDNSSTYGIVIRNTDRYIIIRNCTFVGSGESDDEFIGIYLENTAHIRVEDCYFYNGSYGVKVKSSEDVWVDLSKFYNNTVGVFMQGVQTGSIRNSRFYGNNQSGITLFYARYFSIFSNYICNSSEGIAISYSIGNILGYNKLEFVRRGLVFKNTENSYTYINKINAETFCIWNINGSGNIFVSNTVYGGIYGIYLDNCSYTSIRFTFIDNNSYCGIFARNSVFLNIFNITVRNSMMGMGIENTASSFFNECLVEEIGVGISMKYSKNNTLLNCSVFGNFTVGLFLFTTNSCSYYNMTLIGGLLGIKLLGSYDNVIGFSTIVTVRPYSEEFGAGNEFINNSAAEIVNNSTSSLDHIYKVWKYVAITAGIYLIVRVIFFTVYRVIGGNKRQKVYSIGKSGE